MHVPGGDFVIPPYRACWRVRRDQRDLRAQLAMWFGEVPRDGVAARELSRRASALAHDRYAHAVLDVSRDGVAVVREFVFEPGECHEREAYVTTLALRAHAKDYRVERRRYFDGD